MEGEFKPTPEKSRKAQKPRRITKMNLAQLNKLKGTPYAVFERIVKKIAVENGHNVKWARKAIEALKEESEKMLEERFSKAQGITDVCKKKKVTVEHYRQA
jgi:histone H3/H4